MLFLKLFKDFAQGFSYLVDVFKNVGFLIVVDASYQK